MTDGSWKSQSRRPVSLPLASGTHPCMGPRLDRDTAGGVSASRLCSRRGGLPLPHSPSRCSPLPLPPSQQVLSLSGMRAALQAGEQPGLGHLLLRGVARWEQHPEHLVKAWVHLQHLLQRGGSTWSQLTHWQPCQGCQSPGRKQISHSNWVIEKSLRKGLLAKAWAGCAGHRQESCSTSTVATVRSPKGQREGAVTGPHAEELCGRGCPTGAEGHRQPTVPGMEGARGKRRLSPPPPSLLQVSPTG